MQIAIFSGAAAHEDELEKEANRFMQRSDIEVIDVIFDQKLVPGHGEHEQVYYGQSVIMVKYNKKPIKPGY